MVYNKLLSNANSNAEEIGRAKAAMAVAIKEDLTDQQRLYVTAYYAEGLNIPQIAALFGVHKSTVSRTIKRGLERLRKATRFYVTRSFNRPKRHSEDDDANLLDYMISR